MEKEARVSPRAVWEAWEKAHQVHTEKGLKTGVRSKTQKEGAKGFSYQIIDVKEGESFSILWKSLFVRLIFSHNVKPTPKGSLIQYGFEIRGPFAWLLRRMLEKKIRDNLTLVLDAMVKELESRK